MARTTERSDYFTVSENYTTMETAPNGVGSTARGLTHSSDFTREGLVMQPIHVQRVTPDQVGAVTRILANVAVQSKVDCWECSLGQNKDGYAQVKICGKSYLAHRVMLATMSGLDVTNIRSDQLALHGCDNPACVNPNHLRWGTHADNAQDKVSRGRTYNGRSTRTTCPRGHNLSGANLVQSALSAGRRACMVCNRARSDVRADAARGVTTTFEDAVKRELSRTDKGRAAVARDALS